MKSALRLRRPVDFAYVRQAGNLHRHHHMMISCVENQLDYNRYGFVTSKKVGGASVRNRTKRRLREAAYRIHTNLHQGYDVVVIARPSIVEQPFDELLRILDKLFLRAGLVKEE